MTPERANEIADTGCGCTISLWLFIVFGAAAIMHMTGTG